MSSKYIAFNMNAKKAVIQRTSDHQPIYKLMGDPTFYQEDPSFCASTPATAVLPGNNVLFDVKFNNKNISYEDHAYLRFTVATTDATNSLTPKFDAFSFIDYIKLEVNRGSDKIELNGNDTIMAFVTRWVKEKVSEDRDALQFLADFRNAGLTDTSYSGTQITSTTSQTYFLPLMPFFPFLFKYISNGVLGDVRITLRFVANPSDPVNMCKLGLLSNTTAPAYTQLVTFNNISYHRCFKIIRDLRTVISADWNTVLVPHKQYDVVTYPIASWTNVGTDAIRNVKLSDMSKRSEIQRVHAFIRTIPTAYNDASAGKKYSGTDYIGWKIRESFGDRNILDFTVAGNAFAKRRAQSYELMRQQQINGKILPLNVITHSDNLPAYWLMNTTIDFDLIVNERDTNDVINTTSTDNSVIDYYFDFECSGAVSSSPCELVVMVEYYDEYLWNGNKQLVKQSQ
jgi:hypothetical protein